jgi:hypothetical protein
LALIEASTKEEYKSGTTRPAAPSESGPTSSSAMRSDAPAQETPPTPPRPDYWTPRIGIIALGLVALLCVGALIYLSAQPEPPGTNPPPAEANQPSQTGPVAVEVANDTGALGLLGQIVGVLGTIAAAALGGIAGFLTAARSTGTTPGTTEQQQPGTAEEAPSGPAG